jgi:hypothetical protein
MQRGVELLTRDFEDGKIFYFTCSLSRSLRGSLTRMRGDHRPTQPYARKIGERLISNQTLACGTICIQLGFWNVKLDTLKIGSC